MGSLNFGLALSPLYLTGTDLLKRLTSDPLNLLLALGIVLVVLILLIQLIYVFKVLPNKQSSAVTNRKKKSNSVDKVISQITEQEEQALVNDTELVAVIMAAIKASIGTEAPVDGLIVRSIRKIK